MQLHSHHAQIDFNIEAGDPDIISIILINRGAESLPPFSAIAIQKTATGQLLTRRIETIIEMEPNVAFRFDFSRAAGPEIQFRFDDAKAVNINGATLDTNNRFPLRH